VQHLIAVNEIAHLAAEHRAARIHLNSNGALCRSQSLHLIAVLELFGPFDVSLPLLLVFLLQKLLKKEGRL